MKDWTSFTFFGVGKFFTALNFAESSNIPFSDIICPKYVTSLRRNSHLSICNFKLCSRNRRSTSFNRLSCSWRLAPYTTISSK